MTPQDREFLMKASTGCWANVEPNWFIILDNNIVKEYVVIAI